MLGPTLRYEFRAPLTGGALIRAYAPGDDEDFAAAANIIREIAEEAAAEINDEFSAAQRTGQFEIRGQSIVKRAELCNDDEKVVDLLIPTHRLEEVKSGWLTACAAGNPPEFYARMARHAGGLMRLYERNRLKTKEALMDGPDADRYFNTIIYVKKPAWLFATRRRGTGEMRWELKTAKRKQGGGGAAAAGQ